MKRLMNAMMSLCIFTVTFLSKEILERTDLMDVKESIWQEYLLFLLIYLLVYLFVKLLQFTVKGLRNKGARANHKVKQ